jgi:transcription elongation factor B subunit 1
MSSDALDPQTPITLISSEGDEFVVAYELLCASNVLKRLFSCKRSRDFEEQRTRVVTLRDISSAALRKIIEYCEYKHTYEHSSTAPPRFEIKGEEALELLMAGEFLDI